MGYSHITTNQSSISDLILILDEYKQEYKVLELPHKMRILITKNSVWLESDICDSDCDGHSTTISEKYNRLKLFLNPIKWKIYQDLDAKGDGEFINTTDYNEHIKPKNFTNNPKIKKTRMCKFYLKGNCTKGDKCNFLHRKINKICRYWMEERGCKYGEECGFKHSYE